MKTSKIIFALSFALVFATGFNAMAGQPNTITGKPLENKANGVTYLVRVENANFIMSFGFNYLIMITDETSRRVAPAQPFRPGVSDYRFVEGGTVRGTRVASMVRIPFSPLNPVIPPTAMTGIFYGGSSYLLVIHPFAAGTATRIDEW